MDGKECRETIWRELCCITAGFRVFRNVCRRLNSVWDQQHPFHKYHGFSSENVLVRPRCRACEVHMFGDTEQDTLLWHSRPIARYTLCSRVLSEVMGEQNMLEKGKGCAEILPTNGQRGSVTQKAKIFLQRFLLVCHSRRACTVHMVGSEYFSAKGSLMVKARP